MANDDLIRGGTATVAANGTQVTGQSVSWVNVREGDFFGAHRGLAVPIAAIAGSVITLAYPWPGAAQTAAAYAIQPKSDAVRFASAVRDLIALLSDGDLAAIAELGSAPDKIPYYTGPGTAALASITAQARNLLAASTATNACGAIGAVVAANPIVTGALQYKGNAPNTQTITDEISRTDGVARWRRYYNADESIAWAPHSASGAWLGTAHRIFQDRTHIFASNSNLVPGYGTGAGAGITGSGMIANGVSGNIPNLYHQRSSLGDFVRYYYGDLFSEPPQIGRIATSDGLSVSYNTVSDYRIKTDVKSLVSFEIEPDDFAAMDNALLRVMGMRPVSYRRIDDPAGALQTGFLAHELQQVAPHAVTGAKDAVQDIGRLDIPETEDSPASTHENVPADLVPEGGIWTKTGTSPLLQGVDHAKITPDLAAALQALTLMVLAQDKRIAALEAQLPNAGE